MIKDESTKPKSKSMARFAENYGTIENTKEIIVKLNEKALKEAAEAAYKSSIIRRGFKFSQIVCLIFIVAKVLQLVTFSWWWVFAPLWLPPAVILGAIISVVIVIAVGVLIVYLVCLLLDKISAYRKVRARKKLQAKVFGVGNSKEQ